MWFVFGLFILAVKPATQPLDRGEEEEMNHQTIKHESDCLTYFFTLCTCRFQGTADAVRQYMWLFDEAVRDGVEDYLILSGVWRLFAVMCAFVPGLTCPKPSMPL